MVHANGPKVAKEEGGEGGEGGEALVCARIDACPGQEFTQGAGACTFGGSKVLLDSWSTSKRLLLND